MDVLRTFYNNESQREAVRVFMIEMLKEMAVERAFTGDTVEGIQEANEMVVRMFERLEEQYGKKQEPLITNSK